MARRRISDFEAELSLSRLCPRLDASGRRRPRRATSSTASSTASGTSGPAVSAVVSALRIAVRLLLSPRANPFDRGPELGAAARTDSKRSTSTASTSRRGSSRRNWSAGRSMSICSARTSADCGSTIPYFQNLGLTYLHLMPLFAVRPGDNDGGYAISNYRSVDPRLGTIDDLRLLAERTARSRHQFGARLRVQPHLRRSRMGPKSPSRQPRIPAVSITSSPTARSPTSTSGRCGRSFPPFAGATSRGTTGCSGGSGRPSTAFSGI